MSKTSFENLEVYHLAERLADEIWSIEIKRNCLEECTVGQQMVRSADSILANIALGAARYNHKDNCRFIKIARGSFYETKTWLRRSYKRNLLADNEVEKVKPIIDELLPRLNAYFRSIKNLSEKSN